MGNVDAVNADHRVAISARVPPDLAEAVAALADAGDRTVSREVFRAIKRHVEMSTSGNGSFVDSESESASGRGSFVDDPAERRETSEGVRQLSSPAHAGEER